MVNILKYSMASIIPIIMLIIVLYGIVKKVKVYEAFVEGAKDGINICIRILPYLLAILIAIKIFRESSLLDYLILIIKPIVSLVGIPGEIIPLILVKPLSGSGAIGIFTETIKTYGVDTHIGLIASIIMGSTETIFYTLTVYYGSIGIKKIRHTLWAAITADIVAILVTVTIVNIWFK
ncbi:spore maturation protein [Clostridium sp.]|uniref:spore maturation protein n=1 Tax=Clostridium sp. TaxID=1506 RepID=UPI0034644B3D